MRLLPPNTYEADPALRSLLGTWLSPPTLALWELWDSRGERDGLAADCFELVVDGPE